MTYHLKRVSKIAKKYGFECDIWSDMLFNAYIEAKDKENFKMSIPKNITPISWRYYKKSEQASCEEFELYLKISNNNFGFAGGAQKWSGFVPDNTYSFGALDEQIESCKKYSIKRFLLTAWADGAADASMFSTLPAIFYTSLKAHDKNLNKKEKAYFKEIVGMDFDDFMLVDLLNRNIPETKPTDFNNLSFVFLYNDLLQGLFDEAVPNDSYNLYNETAKKLNKNCKNKEFGYLFKSLKDLSNVLKYKADLGKSIYNHYKDGDVDGLKNDVSIIIKSKYWLGM